MRAALSHDSPIEQQHLVAARRFADVVGCSHHGSPAGKRHVHQGAIALAPCNVQTSGGLVEHQQVGIPGHHLREVDPLLLSTRQRTQWLVGEVGDLHMCQGIVHQLSVACGGAAQQTEGSKPTHSNDFDRPDGYHEACRMRLPEIGDSRRARARLPTQHFQLAGDRRDETEDRFEQRRFARAIGPHQRQRLTGLQCQKDAVDDCFGAVADRQRGCRQCCGHQTAPDGCALAATVRAEPTARTAS